MEVFKVDPVDLGLLGDHNWLSFVIFFDLAARRNIQFMSSHSIPAAQQRWSEYASYLHDKYINTCLSLHHGRDLQDVRLRYVLQGEDCTRNIKSVAWESQRDWPDVTLIPDPYYFAERGYEDFLPEGAAMPEWSARRPAIVWRGSTTGVAEGAHTCGIGSGTLDRLPRYRMCRILQRLGPTADVGFVSIVQCPDGDREAILARLATEGLMTPYIPSRDMVNFKFLVDIDGNANSWNFIQRLRMGCCILKVDSPWIQWFDHRIEPWVHYVPVKADLSDLLERAEWCLTHDSEAARIAENSRRLGLSFRFEMEMRQAALDILQASEPLSRDAGHLAALQQVCAAVDERRPAWEAAITAWPTFPEPMWLKTAHGTILGSDGAGNVIQLPLIGDKMRAITLFDGDRRGFDMLGGLRIDRIGEEISLERQGLFLAALPDLERTVCDRPSKGAWETFTLIPAPK